MKTLLALLATLLLTGSVTAQHRLQFGVRGGVNTVQHRFEPINIDGTCITQGNSRIGYDAGAVVRFNFTQQIHLQIEGNYVFSNYGVNLTGNYNYTAILKTQRFDIPVELGVRIARIVRIFGGVVFRAAESRHSTAPGVLCARFSGRDIRLIGGIGLETGRFFFDFRITGYPNPQTWDTFTLIGSAPQRTRVHRSVTYGGSIGFFF